MDLWKQDRVRSAIEGRNPTVMATMDAGFAVMGDVQWLLGYSLLITDQPGVDRLSDLSRSARLSYLQSLDALAEAVEESCRELDPAFTRVNIEILGNADPFLHAHIWPRYEWEPEELRRLPVWFYPKANWQSEAFQLGPQHDSIRGAITKRLGAVAHD
ncbi:HIT family protein [Arthrobacter roseus]|uniref:HIT family protein n=1 Tax=Arthrobacter roseus TaxID=136274 RepID=UPI0019650C8B|nr:diadenosine tetraphosphate hydrolase [Arthrobacter roseus]MBM7847069.1 diadenosine tetraphosphate (Ap4A) HIT family hydrolase [Arthrobacter roseus]